MGNKKCSRPPARMSCNIMISIISKKMVTWIPSTKNPFMLAFFYQHHGSVMGKISTSKFLMIIDG